MPPVPPLTTPPPAPRRSPRSPPRVDVRRLGLIAAVLAAAAGGTVVIMSMGHSGGGSTPGRSPTDARTLPGDSAPPTDIAALGLQSAGRARIQLTDRADRSRVIGVLEFDDLTPRPDGRADIANPRQIVFLRDGRTLRVEARRGTIVRQAQTAEPESGSFEGDVTARLLRPAPATAAPVTSAAAPGPSDPGLVIATLTTDSLRFDRALFELSTSDRFSLRSDAAWFEGRGFRLVWNEVQSRPETLVVEERTLARVFPAAWRGTEGDQPRQLAPTPTLTSSPTPPPTSPPPTPPTRPPTTPLASTPSPITTSTPDADDRQEPSADLPAGSLPLQHYRVTLAENVIITSGTRRLESDRAQVLLTMLGGSLPPGAIARPPAMTRAPDPAPGDARPEEPDQVSTRVQRSISGAGDLAGDDPIDLSWDGRLVLRAVEPEAAETGREPGVQDSSVVVRFESAPAAPARYNDREAGAQASAGLIVYDATRAHLRLDSASGHAVSAAAAAGRIDAAGLSVDLPGAVVRVDSPGRLRPATPGDVASPAGIDWTGSALFRFEPDGWISERLLTAEVFGVRVIDRDSTITADRLLARFADAGERRRRLTSAAFSGDVRARAEGEGTTGQITRTLLRTIDAPGLAERDARVDRDADGTSPSSTLASTLSSRALTVEFEPTPAGTSTPVRVIASGQVEAERGGSRLRSGTLDAALTPDQAGRPSVALVHADGGITFTERDPALSANAPPDIAVTGQRLSADVPARTVRVFGTPGDPARIESPTFIITGERLTADADTRELLVPGAGTLRTFSQRPEPAGEPPITLEARWSGALRYSDLRGEGELEGDVLAVSTPDPRQIDTLRGQRLSLAFTPGRGGEADDALSTRQPRRLLRAELTGAAPDSTTPAEPDAGRAAPPARASIESRRLREHLNVSGPLPEGADPLERLIYLEGPTIVASQTLGRLEVPGAGRLLVDQRPSPTEDPRRMIAAARPSPDPFALSGHGSPGADGTTLFTWIGSMTLDDRQGRAAINNGVRLIHRPSSAQGTAAEPVIVLDCATLTADFVTPAQPSEAAEAPALPDRARLLQAVAVGVPDVPAVLTRASQRLQADVLLFNPERRTVLAEARPDSRVRFFDEANPAPVSAESLLWEYATGRISVRQPGGTAAPR